MQVSKALQAMADSQESPQAEEVPKQRSKRAPRSLRPRKPGALPREPRRS
jgi:hypothetical protein